MRLALIVAATVLGVAATFLAREAFPQPDLKGWLKVLAGVSALFVLFFAAVRFIDDYFWWAVPAVAFICAMLYALHKLGIVDRAIEREKPDRWLTETLAAAEQEKPIPATVMADFGLDEPESERRFLDDFHVDLDGLDQYIFTSRHGYLVHDPDGEGETVCDVVTITPGMSLAALIETAARHKDQCVKKETPVATGAPKGES